MRLYTIQGYVPKKRWVMFGRRVDRRLTVNNQKVQRIACPKNGIPYVVSNVLCTCRLYHWQFFFFFFLTRTPITIWTSAGINCRPSNSTVFCLPSLIWIGIYTNYERNTSYTILVHTYYTESSSFFGPLEGSSPVIPADNISVLIFR